MSAPQTNLEKQEKRHWGSLGGITIAVLAAVAAGVYFFAAPPVEGDAADPDGTPEAVMEQADDMEATPEAIEADRALDDDMDEAAETGTAPAEGDADAED
ncbi:hypothetical protein [Pseudooctadecabacter jejudonensis]|uniref:Uncharacterized protein n=1 Tax=Pseudooctadecabacter jejudonensis TaxID=1391910 RepID=A0A1Y5RSP7_9RHOB|nr:hypothetical protein [Pseudooctadecabacter jejudonensis]SLN23495.1 hypothetical protein PSJ8397_00995 [Pseudooctadecabacter jejudonensis]